MKTKIQSIISVFLFLFVFSVFTVTADADTAGELAVNGNQVSVKLRLPEGKTETITSLRLKLYVSVERGEMEAPTFQFADGLASEVKDAAVNKIEEDYTIDLILSGKQKQDIFQGKEEVSLGILQLRQKEGSSFTATVGIAGENGEITEDNPPAVWYVDSSGISMETLFLNAAAPVPVEYKQPEKEEPGKEEPDKNETPVPGENSGQQNETLTVPAKVTDVKVIYKDNAKVTASWKKVKGAGGYEIYRSKKKNGKYKLQKRVKNGGRNSGVQMKHKDGKTYYYKIRAYVSGTDGKRAYGEFSDAVLAAVAKTKAAAEVKNASRKITFTWKQAARADGYKIYKYNGKTKKYKVVANVKKADTWSKKFKYGSSYTFRIRAYEKRENGEKIYGAFSKPVKVTTAPAEVSILKAKSENKGEASLLWKNVRGASGYQIYVSGKKTGSYEKIKRIPGKMASYTDTRHKTGQICYYKIRAYSKREDGNRIYGRFSLPKAVRIK